MISYEEVYAKLVKDSQINSYLDEADMTPKAKKEFLMYIIIQTLKYGKNAQGSVANLPHDYVVIDIESTGLARDKDEVIQLSAIKYYNDKQVEQFDTFVKPVQPLTGFISNLTGITAQMLEDAPTFHEIASSYRSFIGNYPIVGHNIVRFDIPFLKANGMTFGDNRLIDTFLLAKTKRVPASKYSLPTLKNYFDIHNRSHNSLNDCKTTAIVYQHLAADELASVLVKNHHQSIFDHQKVVVYGTFEGISNSQMKQLVVKYGGRVTQEISKDVDIFIDGEKLENGPSLEEKTAHDFFEKCGHLQIMNGGEITQRLKKIESAKWQCSGNDIVE